MDICDVIICHVSYRLLRVAISYIYTWDKIWALAGCHDAHQLKWSGKAGSLRLRKDMISSSWGKRADKRRGTDSSGSHALSSCVNSLPQGQSTTELTLSHLHRQQTWHCSAWEIVPAILVLIRFPSSLLCGFETSQGSLVTMLELLDQWKESGGSASSCPPCLAVECSPVRVTHTPKTLTRPLALQDKRPSYSISQTRLHHHPAPKTW